MEHVVKSGQYGAEPHFGGQTPTNYDQTRVAPFTTAQGRNPQSIMPSHSQFSEPYEPQIVHTAEDNHSEHLDR